jgi:hypothetical protein
MKRISPASQLDAAPRFCNPKSKFDSPDRFRAALFHLQPSLRDEAPMVARR